MVSIGLGNGLLLTPWNHSPEQCWLILIHWGQVTHICIGNLTTIGSENGLSPGRRQSHYLNHCWKIVNCTLRNKLQWNFNQNSNVFIHENALQNLICEMASTLPQPQCVNQWSSVAFTWSNFTGNAPDMNHWTVFENCIFKITSTSLRGQWVNRIGITHQITKMGQNFALNSLPE